MIALHAGDCLKVLHQYASNSFDSMVTDPPSGISFMGAKWDADHGGRDLWIWYMRRRFRAAFRVLKPGAHGLVWALPRTSHWTATALEDAGFEIRDVATHLFGQGFPKSLNVSKAIDKSAGAEREVIGTRVLTGNAALSTKEKGGTYGVGVGTAPAKEVPITAPATESAREWDGWGTALKPASEHWILVRKPLAEDTVAANVLAHRTGAINIDGSRIFTDWSERPDSWKASGHSAKPDADKIAAPPGTGINCHPQGRWPANVLLTHSDGCDVSTVMVTHEHPQAPSVGPVRSGRCAPDCPIRLLDLQAGPTGAHGRGDQVYEEKRNVYSPGLGARGAVERDTGTASRFFYCGKATKKDRGEGNDHPTVKPTELMRYWLRLITPPHGTVLDPFSGSGSTVRACALEGFSCVGIDLAEKNIEITRRRLGELVPLFARTA